MARGRDVNKVESRTKTGHHNEKKMKQNQRVRTVTALAAAVTNKAISRRQNRSRRPILGGNHRAGVLSTVQLAAVLSVRGRRTASASSELSAALWPGERKGFLFKARLINRGQLLRDESKDSHCTRTHRQAQGRTHKCAKQAVCEYYAT